MSTIDTIDIHDEVNRLSDIDDVERLKMCFEFANNTEHLLILVLFFPASYRQTRPKKHIRVNRRATRCCVLNALCFEIIVLFTRYFCNGN
ncbi:unnamed protein product [Rhizophagus irregularis]|nr:unnamed protein product [Rhizophagus irregularis]